MDTVPAVDRCTEIMDLVGTGDSFVYFMAFAYFRYEADNHSSAVDGPALAPGVPHFVSVIHSPSGTNGPAQATLRQDGSVYSDGAKTFPLPKGIHFKNGLGGDIDSWCDQFHGYIAELLVYNRAVSYEEEMAINARMQNEWQCCGQAPLIRRSRGAARTSLREIRSRTEEPRNPASAASEVWAAAPRSGARLIVHGRLFCTAAV